MKTRYIFLFFIAFLIVAPQNIKAAMADGPTFKLKVVAGTANDPEASFMVSFLECENEDCIGPDYRKLWTENGYGFLTYMPIIYDGQQKTYSLKLEDVTNPDMANVYCKSNNPETIFINNENTITFEAKANDKITCVFGNPIEPPQVTPVLIVPGIMGSEIYKFRGRSGGDEILLWPNISKMLISSNDDFMDPLAFDDNLKAVDENVRNRDVIINPSNLFDYTGSLINEFANQGYIEDENLFTFSYDWRYGVSGVPTREETNSQKLKRKIDSVWYLTGYDKIDIIAHSNGGLLVKKYVVDNPGDDMIRRAVFVGVPNTGAPKAIKALIEGDDFGVHFAKWGLSELEMKKITKNMPVAYDLLPTKTYYGNKGSFLKTVDNNSVFNFFDTEKKDLDYDEFKSYMIKKGFNSTALENSQNLHTIEFDNFDLRQMGIDVYNIVGCKTPTMASITEVINQDFFGNEYSRYDKVSLNTGDGTVPIESSTNLPTNTQNRYYLLKSDHSKMMSADGSRQQIVNLIAGSNLNVNSNVVTQEISRCQLNGKGFAVYNSADVFITDTEGNRLGKDIDGTIYQEIWGADYMTFEERVFFFLPTDEGQKYTVSFANKTPVTGNTSNSSNTTTIKVYDIQNSQSTKLQVFGNLPINLQSTGTMNVSATDPVFVVLMQNEVPEEKQTILPNPDLAGDLPDDFTPPVSTATTADNKIKINATDGEGTEVLEIHYNLDNSADGFITVKGGETTIEVTEGKHTITYFATDSSGNNEPAKTTELEVVLDPITTDDTNNTDTNTGTNTDTGTNSPPPNPENPASPANPVVTVTGGGSNIPEIKSWQGNIIPQEIPQETIKNVPQEVVGPMVAGASTNTPEVLNLQNINPQTPKPKKIIAKVKAPKNTVVLKPVAEVTVIKTNNNEPTFCLIKTNDNLLASTGNFANLIMYLIKKLYYNK